MRIIPKKSKINPTVWMNFTLFDIMFAFALAIVAFLIAMSNFKFKWPVLLVYVSCSIILFFSSDGDRMYKDIIYIFRFWFSKKKYVKGAAKKKSDVSELIPFKDIDNDGIVIYNGYFGAVLSISSVEFALLDEFEQNRRISVFAQMLNGFGENATLQLVKVDRPINYDDVASKLFTKLETAQNETVQDKAKIAILKSRLAQIDDINNIDKQYRPYYYLVIYDNERDMLLRQIDYARSSLDNAGLAADLLSKQDVAVFFKYCYTRNFDERGVEDAENLSDYVKPDSIKFTQSSCMVDDVYSFTFAISDYPLVVGNAWGANLFNINNTKVVLTIKPVEKDKAVKRIDKAVVELETRRGSGKISEAIGQETHVETMSNLAQALQNENEMLFDCTLTVTAYNNTTEENNSAFKKNIRRQIQSGGFKVNALRCRQFDGFATSTISKGITLRGLERGINSESLAAVFPFVFTSIIESDGFTLGYDYYPVVLDIWKRDSKYINSNIFVLGKSGSGKSFFAKTLLSLVYSDNSKIFILDPENEYLHLCRNVGGRFIDVGNATEGRLNPLHIYQILTDDGSPASPEAVFSAHLRFLESFFSITLKGITSDALEELNNLLSKMYALKGITESTDCTQLSPDEFPTFDDLKDLVESEFQNEKSPMRHENLDRIRTYVAKFATSGRFANLWNGPSTITTDERLVVFNFQSLFAAKNTTLANAQMLVIMRYLDQQIINIREQNRNSSIPLHPFLLLDEGYNFVDDDYPIALDFVFLWYKRIRKYDGSIAFLTQNLSDIVGNQNVIQKTTAIINNAQYSFIFSLAPADLQILTDLYKNAGEINDIESNQIATAGNGECFAICAIGERSTFKVVASNVVYTLFDKPNGMQLVKDGNPYSPYEK